MPSKHKIFRTTRRNEWLRINHINSAPFPKHFDSLRKYEKRKRKKRTLYSSPNNIEIPEKLDFEENIENIVQVTQDIKKQLTLHSKTNFSINHKNIKVITIGALLYLVGQISKVTKAKNIGLKYNEQLGLRKKDERIRYLFNKIGYWECFGIPKPYNVQQEIKDSYFLSIQTNTISDINSLNKIKSFIKNKVNFIDNYSVEYKFDDAVKEAMANSIEHAYSENFKEIGKEKGKWWICGHYDKLNNSLELVFYDYGMGIRKSIKRNLGEEADILFFDRVKDKLKKDEDLIELAINSKLTKYNNYKEHDRGKGFKRFKEFAKVSGHDCEMTIVSDRGRYKYFYNGLEKSENVEKISLSNNIEGMLIKWKIQLNGKG